MKKYNVVVYTSKKEYYEVEAENEELAEWNYGTQGKKVFEKIHEQQIDVYEED